ncbi:MAG: 50S ribosomal protein L10 [Nanoarchaeota archaeon]|nr:50S ribosomal protein L10 [Nanoarchaeota archaeon]
MVQEWKKQKVKKLKNELKNAKVVGIVDLDELPAKQLQSIKKSLNQKIHLKITKKSILRRALKGEKQEKLLENLGRMPALIITNENPFKIFKTLKQNQSNTYAKAGQTIPENITIPAGPTEFGPGPMISEFGALGIKTKIEKGKITIQNDTVILKDGDTITLQQASFLQKMDIKPMKIGINLVSAYDDGTVFLKNVLNIDENAFMNNLTLASQHAFNLSVEARIFTKENVEIFLTQASNHAKNLGMEATIYDKDLIQDQLLKAHNQAINLR